MNLQHYINTTRDKTGLGHSWDKSWWPWGPEVRSWAMAILEDPWRTTCEGGPMATGQWSQAAGAEEIILILHWLQECYWRLCRLQSHGLSPYEQVEHTISSPRAEHLMIYFTLNRVLWECFAIQAKKIKTFFSDADSNTNEGALSTLSLTYFWVQFCLDYFYLCTWDAKWTTPDFSAANRGGRSWFSIFKNQHVSPIPMHKMEI